MCGLYLQYFLCTAGRSCWLLRQPILPPVVSTPFRSWLLTWLGITIVFTLRLHRIHPVRACILYYLFFIRICYYLLFYLLLFLFGFSVQRLLHHNPLPQNLCAVYQFCRLCLLPQALQMTALTKLAYLG